MKANQSEMEVERIDSNQKKEITGENACHQTIDIVVLKSDLENLLTRQDPM
jgi:hypothetical protein